MKLRDLMKSMTGTPIQAIQHDNKNSFCATTDISNAQQSIQPDSEILHYRSLPSEQAPSIQVAFPFQERYAKPEKVIHPKLPLETSLDVYVHCTYNKSTTRLKTVRNWSLLLHRVLICFEEAINQARSFRAAMETATCIRLFHHYYTYGAAHAVSNPVTWSIISMVQPISLYMIFTSLGLQSSGVETSAS